MGALTIRRAIKYSLIAAGLIGGAFLLVKLITTSDEPPIRVRGGSIEAEIVKPGSAYWDHAVTGSDHQWKVLSNGENGAEEYFLKVIRNGGSCTGAQPEKAKTVKVTQPSQTFTVRAVQKKTVVTTGAGVLKLSAARIKYAGLASHYVDSLWVQSPGSGAPWECQFRERDQFVELCLCKTKEACEDICNP